MTIPTKQDFATEVRADRLKVLWQVTLFGSILLFWTVATLATVQRMDAGAWLISLFLVSLGCFITRFLLVRDYYVPAVWSYALGGVLGVAVLLAAGDATARQIIPFVFPVIIFVVGLLLTPVNTLLLSALAALVIVFAPALVGSGLNVNAYSVFAIFLTFLGAVLAAQVTGELYQVTEWALLNYQRERRTTEALFENRQLLERSLLRSQALSEKLQETNVELETARAAAEEAKHFRGQFLANMSHELRTPLNAIIGFSETMLKFPQMYDGLTLPDAYKGDLEQIYTSGKQLLHLINDILDLSKVDAGKLELHTGRVQLEPIIDMVLTTAAGLLGSKPVKLERDYVLPLPLVWGDETRVRQVLLNLYSNATKFTDSGSITLSIREMGDNLRFTVKDTGVGIDLKYHEVIFEEFKQAETLGRDPRAGAGLGLAICRHLLDLMNGRVWVESDGAGKGSAFHFTLPLYRADLDTRPTRILALRQEPEKVISS